MSTIHFEVSLTQAGEGVQVWLPSGWAFNGAKPLVIAMHGIGTNFQSNIYQSTPDVTCLSGNPGNALFPVINALCNAGYPVLSIDNGGLCQVGNAASLTSITNAITYGQNATAAYPGPRAKAGKVVLVGYSQGGLSAMNFIARNLTSVSAMVSIVGAMDVDDIYDNNRGSFAPYFDAGYPATVGTPKGDYNAAITYSLNDCLVNATIPYQVKVASILGSTPPNATNYNVLTTGASGAWKTNGKNASPSFNPHQLAGATLAQFPPCQLWVSSGDTVCLSSTQTFIATAIGANATTVTVPGNPTHGNCPLAVPPATVVSFVQANT